MKKLNGPLDVGFINRTFFSDYYDVSVINQGECFRWAYIAYRLYNDVELWDIPSHAFVRSKTTGLYYDSETPDGEVDWRDLPATNFGVGCGCGRCGEPPRHFKVLGFFRFVWRGMAKRYETDWHLLNQQITELIYNES